jgi:multidrug efflux pump subunit AcrB
MRALPDLASRAPLKEKFHEGELWNLIGVIVSRVIVVFAIAMYSGVVGAPIGYLRQGRKNIPIVQLMDYGQRETVTDLSQLYVYSSQSPVRVTLGQISRLTYSAETAVIHRVNQYRAINVAASPAPGGLAEELTAPLMPRIRASSNSKCPLAIALKSSAN